MSTRNQLANVPRGHHPGKDQSNRSETSVVNKDGRIVRAKNCVAQGDYQAALAILREFPKDPQVQNDIGVCLMRLGRVEEANKLLRDLVFEPGAIWIRPNVAVTQRLNCATALLLMGHPAGCLDTLVDIDPKQNPRIQEVHNAIKSWEKTLSLWSRFNWWLGRVEPSNIKINLDFVPGDFELIDPTSPD